VTHHHPDHCGLADRICEEHGAELLMSAQAYEAALVLQHRAKGTDATSIAADLAKHGLAREAQRFLIDHESDLDYLKPGMPPRFTALADGDTMSVGGRTLEVIFGQGHAPDHVACTRRAPGAAAWAGRAARPAGPVASSSLATCCCRTSPRTWARPRPGCRATPWPSSRSRCGAWRLCLPTPFVLPSHGAPFYGARERVAELERHHEQRCLTMLALLGEPRSAAELLAEVFKRDLDPLQLMFAMNEAVAHLEYMTDRGDAQRQEGEDGIIRYVRKDTRGRR